jgi:hypothetical protein
MHISGLDLGAWIMVYMGFMLVRGGIPLSKADGTPGDPRRVVSYIGYGLLVLGVGIFVFALRIH